MKYRRSISISTGAAAVVCAALLTLMLTSSALAAGGAVRISGDFRVNETVVASVHGDTVGTVFRHVPFRFVPLCKHGACTTLVTRFPDAKSHATIRTEPRADGTYAGSTTYLGLCYLANGGTVANALRYRESVFIRGFITPGSSSANLVKGRLHFGFTPTAIGKQAGCMKGSETLRLRGLKK